MRMGRFVGAAAMAGLVAAGTLAAEGGQTNSARKARNVIFFVGDGMGVSTVTATRVYSVGVDGQLVVDQFPYTALSRTYSEDAITPDSAPTMTAMMTGVNTNQSVIGFGKGTEPNDFNNDGDGPSSFA
jgi:alkaline phosphatase